MSLQIRTLLILTLLGSACASRGDPAAPAAAPPPSASSLGAGYLAPADLPDMVALLPRPPAPGSAAEARDLEAQGAALKLRGSPRWDLATRDADLFSIDAMRNAFSCAAGFIIAERETPRLYTLLRRSASNLAYAGFGAKEKYGRPRPYLQNSEPICTPQEAERLRGNGSYPSGHASIGFGWGLILAEIAPARATELVARGRDFADSRRVCNVHWLSDIEAGEVVAAAVVARLHADPAFAADLAAAKAEAASAPAASGCESKTASR